MFRRPHLTVAFVETSALHSFTMQGIHLHICRQIENIGITDYARLIFCNILISYVSQMHHILYKNHLTPLSLQTVGLLSVHLSLSAPFYCIMYIYSIYIHSYHKKRETYMFLIPETYCCLKDCLLIHLLYQNLALNSSCFFTPAK